MHMLLNGNLLTITIAHCTANGETEAKEPFCKIIDNSCLEDALVGSPWMPQAKRATEREHAIIREQTV